MSGRYNKAPLVYVSATIHTTVLPQLIGDQPGLLDQLMIQLQLPARKVSQGRSVKFGLNDSGGGDVLPEVGTCSRLGYFSADSTESLIFDERSIELRTTSYTTYGNLCSRMEELFSGIFSAIEVYKNIVSKELVLSYVDVIVPCNGRRLADYFSNPNILPLSSMFVDSDIQTLGKLDVSRVVTKDQKVNVSLEQLPVIDNVLPKIFPESMAEPDTYFGMPISVQSKLKNIAAEDYALLLSQSKRLLSKKLSELEVEKDFQPLHLTTKETFEKVIDADVCNVDWEYQNV
jgi:uncharacterized protein (TIGR04255 family)